MLKATYHCGSSSGTHPQPLCEEGQEVRTGRVTLACSLSAQDAEAGGLLELTLNRDQRKKMHEFSVLVGDRTVSGNLDVLNTSLRDSVSHGASVWSAMLSVNTICLLRVPHSPKVSPGAYTAASIPQKGKLSSL